MVTARKYRPKSFKEVFGQEPIVQTLQNAIRMERVSHAYLFCGSQGTGKTTLARLFAKALNCPSLTAECEPCNKCAICRDIDNGCSIDVLEIDGASHRGIEDIRQINETCAFAPSHGKFKIYLIDEVHMLTKEAFNALLKTLEEPPERVKFFFATTEMHKVPATILSRCQRFNLRRIPAVKIVEKLTYIASDLKVEVEPAALEAIARIAEGGLRDAESLFDQLLSFEEGKITFAKVAELLGLPSKDLLFSFDQAAYQGDLTTAFSIAKEAVDQGKNILFFGKELFNHFRTLLLIKQKISQESDPRYIASADLYSSDQLQRILTLIQEAERNASHSLSEKIWLEQLLLSIIQTHKKISIESLVTRLIELETRLEMRQLAAPPPREKPPVEKPPIVEPPRKPSPVPEREPIPPTQLPPEKQPPDIKTKISFSQSAKEETMMRFASKELGGNLKID